MKLLPQVDTDALNQNQFFKNNAILERYGPADFCFASRSIEEFQRFLANGDFNPDISPSRHAMESDKTLDFNWLNLCSIKGFRQAPKYTSLLANYEKQEDLILGRVSQEYSILEALNSLYPLGTQTTRIEWKRIANALSRKELERLDLHAIETILFHYENKNVKLEKTQKSQQDAKNAEIWANRDFLSLALQDSYTSRARSFSATFLDLFPQTEEKPENLLYATRRNQKQAYFVTLSLYILFI